MTKNRTEVELWKALELLGDDSLDPNLPMSIIDDRLKKAGADPTSLAKEGEDLVARLKEEQRLAWQRKARRHQEEFARRGGGQHVPFTLGRAEILSRLNGYRNDARLGAPVVIAFRKRKPEESSDEELRELLEDVEALRTFDGDDDGTK